MSELRLISSTAATHVPRAIDTPSPPFSVTAIGSCRIVGPLRLMQLAGQMILNQSGVYGYSHSCMEVRQHLTHLLDGTRPPSELTPLLSQNLEGGNRKRSAHKLSDFYVFELSSAKHVSVDGHPVQLNYLNRHFRTFFSDSARARTFWSHARHSDLADMKAFLADLPEYKALSSEDQRLLRAIRLDMTTPAQLRLDIDAIRSKVPNHLFVTHFDAFAPNGAPLKARATYLKMLREALNECGATWYDPSPSVHAFGQKLAINDPEKSLSHYSSPFEEYLCSDWWMRFIDPVRQRKKMDALTRGRIRSQAVSATFKSVMPDPVMEDV